MKKVAFCSIFFLLMCCFSLTCFADSASNSVDTFTLDEVGISISIPNSYYVVKRDTPKTDTVFSEIGISYSDFMALMKNNNIYLNAIAPGSTDEIVVTMIDNSINNYNSFDDASLESYEKSLVSLFQSDYGYIVSSYDIYKHPQAKFMKIIMTDAAQTSHIMQLYTIFDNKAINVTLRSYDGEITTQQKKDFMSIIESIVFANYQETADIETSEAFQYIDNTASITFTVPANWQKVDFEKERQYLNLKIKPIADSSVSIIFGANNLWDTLSNADKKKYLKSELDDSVFTKSDAAEAFGISSNQIIEKYYNNIHFYTAQVEKTFEIQGISFVQTINYAIHIQNGWMYHFQFSDSPSSQYYDDYIKLLNSVEIKGSTISTDSEQNKPIFTDSDSIPTIVICIVGVSVFLVFLIIAKEIGKTSKEKKQQCIKENNATLFDTANQSTDEPAQTEDQKYIFCYDCGTKQPFDCVFCKNCGKKLKK